MFLFWLYPPWDEIGLLFPWSAGFPRLQRIGVPRPIFLLPPLFPLLDELLGRFDLPPDETFSSTYYDQTPLFPHIKRTHPSLTSTGSPQRSILHFSSLVNFSLPKGRDQRRLSMRRQVSIADPSFVESLFPGNCVNEWHPPLFHNTSPEALPCFHVFPVSRILPGF